MSHDTNVTVILESGLPVEEKTAHTQPIASDAKIHQMGKQAVEQPQAP